LVLIKPSALGIANLKTLVLCFENMSGLKINFDKSEVVVTGVPRETQRDVAYMLNYKLGSFPIHYLGMPVSDRLLRVADWVSSQIKRDTQGGPLARYLLCLGMKIGADQLLPVEPPAFCHDLVFAPR
jgi:hypothetical protein